MAFEDQPMVSAISDPEALKLINEELGSTFELSNIEPKIGDDDESSWIIARITDGKIEWFNAWIE